MALDSSRRRDFLILAAERQERERQIGADTSKGYFMSDATDMNQYNGDRSFQMVVRAGEDVQSRQALRDAEPLGFVINDGNIYINLLGMWVCGYSVNANTTYHVVATFNKATMRAKLYVAGAFVSESKPRETEATYSSYFSIGNNRSANNPVYPFQGAIMLNRDFDYELTAEEVMSLDHNGDPAGYVLPGGMKYRWEASESDIKKISFYPNNTGTGVASYFEDNANGFSGRYAHIIPGGSGSLSVYSTPFEGHPAGCIVEGKFKYRSNAPVLLLADYSSHPINTGDAVDVTVVYRTTGTRIIDFGLLVENGDANSWVEIQPVSLRTLGCVAEYLPQNLVVARKQDFPQVVFPVGVYTPSSEVFRVNDPAITTHIYNQPQANGFSGDFMRFDSIRQVSTYCAYWNSYLKKSTPLRVTFEYRSNYAIYISQATTNASSAYKIGEANEGAPIVVSAVYGFGAAAFLMTFANITDGWVELRVLSIEVAEGTIPSWLDSAKQLPLNDEYLPPLLGPIVIGDATPVNITGNNSYTWTGVDDPVYSRNITTSRRPTLGQWYRIVGSISGYEKGYPYISADTGYTEVALPRTDGPFSVLVQCKSAAPSSYYFSYRAGNRGTDRTLTITVDSIEPVVERGCDLTANGTPEIVYKTK